MAEWKTWNQELEDLSSDLVSTTHWLHGLWQLLFSLWVQVCHLKMKVLD
jgi:hypothetical protein